VPSPPTCRACVATEVRLTISRYRSRFVRLINIIKTAFTIPTLTSNDISYTGPTGPSDENDLCKCNTVVYSLMSACGACQGSKWFSCVRPFLFLSSSVRDCLSRRWNDLQVGYLEAELHLRRCFTDVCQNLPLLCPLLFCAADDWCACHNPGSRIPSRMGRACRSGLSST
jgi:hypothetical protein